MTTASPSSRGGTSRGKLVVLGVALLFLGGAAGFALFGRPDHAPGPGSVYAGFLEDAAAPRPGRADVAVHAEQGGRAQDPTVRLIAGDILRTQQFEAGGMAGQLRTWGGAEANESRTGMA